uniref:Uncharacterized protein n=1 Tax=Vitis vinifera TaxID=29760 RepID=F6H887_VITVI
MSSKNGGTSKGRSITTSSSTNLKPRGCSLPSRSTLPPPIPPLTRSEPGAPASSPGSVFSSYSN